MRFGLLGSNINYTISPFIHKELFKIRGEEHAYDVYDISEDKFQDKINSLLELNGFNITIPYKRKIIEYIDETSDFAKMLKSVNTVKNVNGKHIGYNTDAYGIEKTLDKIIDKDTEKVLILGCGNVAETAASVLAERGFETGIAAREKSEHKALAISEKVKSLYKVNCKYENFYNINGKYDIIVNCTPIGTFPNVSAVPVDDEVISGCKGVFDMVYNPIESEFIKRADAMGKKTISGLTMLVYQAVRAQEIWFEISINESRISKIISDSKEYIKENF